MKALSIGWVNIKRMIRERSNIFFVFIFPIALVLLIGVQFGSGFAPVVGIHQAGRTGCRAGSSRSWRDRTRSMSASTRPEKSS